MSLIRESRNSWLPGVLRAKPTYAGSLRDWIVKGDWIPDQKLTSKRARLTVYQLENVVDACVNDAVALSIAAFESSAAASAKSHNPKACAWQFIKYYYSAFFAANALMRLGGFACTNLSATETGALNEQAYLYGLGGATKSDSLQPALFLVEVNAASSSVALHAINAKGGVHAQFWSGFNHYLSSLEVAFKSATTSEKTQALTELIQLQTALGRAGHSSGAWLSEIRNAVNYRFEHGLWFPYRSEVDDKSLRNPFKTVKTSKSVLPVNTAGPDPVYAARCCAHLLMWLYEALVIVHDKAQGTRKKNIAEGVLALADGF
jgi:hypothetical protein